jgi:protein-disulfide isomerase
MTTEQSSRTSTWRKWLDLAATIAVLATCGALLWHTFGTRRATRAATVAALPETPLKIDMRLARGAATAPLVLIEFSEFQCPFCAAFDRNTLPELMNKYVDTGTVKFVFKHFPLEQIHAQAMSYAVAADCAASQDAFWSVHDALFSNEHDDLQLLARTHGLDMQSFDACFAAARADTIRADQALGKQLNVTGTPTFFLGTPAPDGAVMLHTRITGAQPLNVFEAEIRKLQ